MNVIPRFEIYKDHSRHPDYEWYARLVLGKKVIARSEGYRMKQGAQRWVTNLAKWALQAGTVYLD